MSGPAVTVVMPTYKRTGFLLRQSLGSFRRAHRPADGFEVIVVNDGDPDTAVGDVEDAWGGPVHSGLGTAELEATGRVCRYLEVPHGGQCGAVNAGVEAARGRYVIVSHDDDLAHPGKVQLPSAYLDATADAESVYTLPEYVGPNGESDPSMTPPFWLEFMRSHPRLTWGDVVAGDGLCVFSVGVMHRRDTFLEAGGWDPELGAIPGLIDYGGDEYEFHLRLLHGGVVFHALAEVLTGYRQHSGQQSAVNKRALWKRLFRDRIRAKLSGTPSPTRWHGRADGPFRFNPAPAMPPIPLEPEA